MFNSYVFGLGSPPEQSEAGKEVAVPAPEQLWLANVFTWRGHIMYTLVIRSDVEKEVKKAGTEKSRSDKWSGCDKDDDSDRLNKREMDGSN